MHLQLHQIRPVRLVLCNIQHELHRPANPALILRHQNQPPPLLNRLRHPLPERHRPFPGDRQHEPNRRASLHAVNQHLRQLREMPLLEPLQPPNRDTRRFLRVHPPAYQTPPTLLKAPITP